MTQIALHGAAGKMGRMVAQALLEQASLNSAQAPLSLVAALDFAAHPLMGQDIGLLVGLPACTCPLTHDVNAALKKAQVVIDFSSPAATVVLVQQAAAHGIGVVTGTTGLDAGQQDAILQASRTIPIVQASNFSLGVALLTGLVEKAARVLGPAFDAEILEMHHRLKADAPSGTAITLGKAAARGKNLDFDKAKVYSREGQTGPRELGQIGFATLRGGDVVGEHTVLFAGPQERLELTHKAASRAIFANGALRAAQWIVGQPAGLYTMTDVLGLNT